MLEEVDVATVDVVHKLLVNCSHLRLTPSWHHEGSLRVFGDDIDVVLSDLLWQLPWNHVHELPVRQPTRDWLRHLAVHVLLTDLLMSGCVDLTLTIE